MSATLYEQFFAAGSVKSLLTGKSLILPARYVKQPKNQTRKPIPRPRGKNNRPANKIRYSFSIKRTEELSQYFL